MEVSRTNDIIKMAREELKEHIIYEMCLILSRKKRTYDVSDTGTLVANVAALGMTIRVMNDDVKNIIIKNDEEIWLEFRNHNVLVPLNDLSTDDMAAMAKVLEEKWWDLIKN